jgi:DNA repair exonuclease SbcCD nuclease subunit
MKVAIITDLHWGVRNNSLFFLEHQERFFYSSFFPYLEENDIDTVWILGDFFENRKMINVQVMNRATLFLEEFEKRGIKVYCIIGNHDTVFKNTNEVNSLVPTTRAFPNITLIQTYDEIDFDGLKVGFVSWITPDVKDDCIGWIKSTNAKVICGHFEIISFEIMRGVICHNGLEPNLFDRFDSVFSGHFHIKSTNGIIQYLGNPYQTNWGEAGYEKGFHIFDTRTRELEFIRNPVDIYAIINYTDEFNIVNFDASAYQQKIVRVVAESKKSKNKKKLEILIEMVSSVCQSVELIEDNVVLVDSDDIAPISDTAQLIKQFLNSCQIEHLDKLQLQEMVFDIYKEALEKMTTSC